MTLDEVRERNWNLLQADKWLVKARQIAIEHPDWIDSRQGWADVEHARCLQTAYGFYVSAGLGLLAGRVRWLARQRQSVIDAWAKFDRLNAGGCGVA